MRPFRWLISFSVIALLPPGPGAGQAPGLSPDWYELPAARAVDCPEAYDQAERTRCVATELELKALKKHLQKVIRKRRKETPVAELGGFKLSEGRHVRRLAVGPRLIELVFDPGNRVFAVAPVRSCLEPDLALLPHSDQLAEAGELIRRSRAVFPVEARKARVSGAVLLQVVITAEGLVDQVCVMAEIPVGRGFGQAAVEAVRSWRYEPTEIDGVPEAIRSDVSMTFEIQ